MSTSDVFDQLHYLGPFSYLYTAKQWTLLSNTIINSSTPPNMLWVKASIPHGYPPISCDDLLEDANAEIIREKWKQQNLHTGAWVFRKCSSACLLGTMSPQILHFSRLREQWAKCRSIFDEGIALSLHAQIGHSQLASKVKESGKKGNTSA